MSEENIIEIDGLRYKVGFRGFIFRHNGTEWLRSTKTLENIANMIYLKMQKDKEYLKAYKKLIKNKSTHQEAVLALV